MRYAIHTICKIVTDINSEAGAGNLPDMSTHDLSLCYKVADILFERGHRLNYVVVYEGGRLHTILKSPTKQD